MKLNNIEFRWSDCNQKWELLEWFELENQKPYCIVIAFLNFEKVDNKYPSFSGYVVQPKQILMD
jgi:hypothetical protein